jgi:hypothetical protein
VPPDGRLVSDFILRRSFMGTPPPGARLSG